LSAAQRGAIVAGGALVGDGRLGSTSSGVAGVVAGAFGPVGTAGSGGRGSISQLLIIPIVL